jgi:hypothetical protein
MKTKEKFNKKLLVEGVDDQHVIWALCEQHNIAETFNVPDILPETGLIIENETQKVGVWIMPNNNSNGMLEDFISFLVPENDPLLPIVDETLQHIENQKLNQYANIHKSKAKIHTWLAWQENPGTPMGQSITREYLSTDKQTCQKFIAWLTELFSV